MPISPQSVPVSGVADGTGVEDGRPASLASGERRSWPWLTTTTRPASRASGERRSELVEPVAGTDVAASRASGERRSVFAAAAAGTTTAIAIMAASVAIVLEVLRLIE